MSRALDDATTVGIIIALFCVTEGCALALWNAVVRLTERRDTEDDGFWRPEQPNVRIVAPPPARTRPYDYKEMGE